MSRHEVGHRLLAAGEARDRDRLARPVDEPVAVDRDAHRADGRQDALAEEPDLLVPLARPRARASRGCSRPRGTPRSRRCSRPACRRSACTCRAARRSPRPSRPAARRAPSPRRPAGSRPASIPASSSSVSAAPWMFCTLFARYMPAISRAPSRPASRSLSWIEATIVQPMSMSLATLLARVAHEGRRRDRRRQAAVADLAGERLHLRRRRRDVDRRHLSRRLGGAVERRHRRVPGRALVLERFAAEHAARDLDRVAHRAERLRRLHLRVVEEDLRGPEAEDEAAGAGCLLHDARIHRHLHRMAREGRDDPPADRQPLRLARDHAPS